MANRPNRNDPWHGPGSAFEPNQGPAPSDDFAPLDTPPAIGLRQFLDRETRAQAASTGSSETLIPGKLYLRQQPNGTWELLHNRGRGMFDCYPSESREDLIQLAESLQGRN
jgi:hypothetical protein